MSPATPDDPANHFLLLGGATHRNRGDLAMHQGLLRWLRDEFPATRPVFLAANPELTREVLQVESAPSPGAELAQPWTRETPHSTRQRLETWWRCVRFIYRSNRFTPMLHRARAAFVPGSGSMNSLWWHDWLYVKAAEVLSARHHGVPVFMTSQGVGPAFTHWLDRWVAGLMFRACTLVAVRDGEQSLRLLRSLGVPEHKLAHSGDDSLLVPADQGPASSLLANIPAGRLLVGLNVRDSHTYGRGYAKPKPKHWATALDVLANAGHNVHFVFVPISYDAQDDDRVAARKVKELMANQDRVTLVEEELAAAELRGLTVRLHIAAGISYHFLLFCLASGVPALGIWQNPYYEQKQGGLYSLFDQEDLAIPLASLDAPSLASRLASLLQNQAALSSALAAAGQRSATAAQATRLRLRQHLARTGR